MASESGLGAREGSEENSPASLSPGHRSPSPPQRCSKNGGITQNSVGGTKLSPKTVVTHKSCHMVRFLYTRGCKFLTDVDFSGLVHGFPLLGQ